MEPSYASDVKFLVNIDEKLMGDNYTAAGAINAINYARKVVETYIEIIKTPDCLQLAVDDSGIAGMTATKLGKMISMSIINDTEIFKVTVQSNDPQIAKRMADSLEKVLPEYLNETKEGSSKIKPIQSPVLPTKPVSPNVTLNTIIGFLLGFMSSLLVIVLKDVLDVRIKSVDELSRMYGLPILGTIPVFTNAATATKKVKTRAK